ncbi:hypothetical protein [Umezawaea tangerina]|uniref:Uncharacterized protein n=1 Tax=Umezawaea tangerina TaxID=84725 RepID=A0A2T0SX94_9PSEU|nr:hypothetical protein [Umezawaea tangerina]PRY38010.1 hypothetical protein CLV43_109230 [Umezawaea tangerina]
MTSRRGPAFAAAVGDWAAVSSRVVRPATAPAPPADEPGPVVPQSEGTPEEPDGAVCA